MKHKKIKIEILRGVYLYVITGFQKDIIYFVYDIHGQYINSCVAKSDSHWFFIGNSKTIISFKNHILL